MHTALPYNARHEQLAQTPQSGYLWPQLNGTIFQVVHLLWYIMAGRNKREIPGLWMCAASKEDCVDLFWLRNPLHRPATSSILVLYCPLQPFPGSSPHPPNRHPLTSPHPSTFIHQSGHRALTSKSLFTHYPVPWMSCPCWMCHRHNPGEPTLCLEAMASGFDPCWRSPPKHSDAVTRLFEMSLLWDASFMCFCPLHTTNFCMNE